MFIVNLLATTTRQIKLNFVENHRVVPKKIQTSNEDWRLFITSNLEAVELEAFEELDQDRVIRIMGVNSHVDRESHLRNDCSRIEKPILDFHFLQNCDKAVISTSGFGRLGVWNRKEPLKDMFIYVKEKIYKYKK